jgi:hypothetical protein
MNTTSRATYPWQESYFAVFNETDCNLVMARIYEALAAIEQRRLSPVGTEIEEIALLNAEMGIRKLVDEKNASNWV